MLVLSKLVCGTALLFGCVSSAVCESFWEFSDGTRLELDLSQQHEGIHKLYVVTQAGDRRVLWNYTNIEGTTGKVKAMALGNIVAAFREGFAYAGIIADFSDSGMYFLKVKEGGTAPGWIMGAIPLLYSPKYSLNYYGLHKMEFTSIDTFTAQLGTAALSDMPPSTFTVAGSGEFIRDGKPTGWRVDLVNGSGISPLTGAGGESPPAVTYRRPDPVDQTEGGNSSSKDPRSAISIEAAGEIRPSWMITAAAAALLLASVLLLRLVRRHRTP